MNEQLLKAITRLFAIVAKERVTDAEKRKIEEFLLDHIDAEEIDDYLQIFDEYSHTEALEPAREQTSVEVMDRSTEEFVEEWANIVLICKHINMELTEYQKVVMLVKIIELLLADGYLSERQTNLLYYITKLIKSDYNQVRTIVDFILYNEIENFDHKDILIIDDGEGFELEQCKHLVSPKLSGFIAILYLSKIESYLIKYVGISSIRVNGIPLKTRSVSMFPPGSNIRGDKIDPIFYSDVVVAFKEIEPHLKLNLRAENVSLRFGTGVIGLRNINIFEESGKLIGVMGASGSGKSTLFEVLNGKRKPILGKVTINGVDIHKNKKAVEGIIGYVPQDDMLVEELTVYQNIYYAALLSYADYNEVEINDIVKKTLISLGLFDIKDLKVGNPLNKTISGGQRKRLNIALELIREPDILYLDEPTSGLSSRDSENIMDLLKELALKGKMVFAIIHQPSSDIFKMFDSLIILDVGGYQIYYGNPTEALVYFKDIINMVNRDQGICITCGNVKVEQIFNIIETRVVDEYGRLTERRKISAPEWNRYFLKRFKPPKKEENLELPKSKNYKIPGRKNQFKIYTSRDLLAKISNRQYLFINLMEAPLLAFILAYFIRYYDKNSAGGTYNFFDNPNIPAYFFMSIIVALFMGLTVSAEEIIRDRKLQERESFLNLSRGSYLASKLFILFCISAIQTFSFIIIGNLILEFKGMYFPYWMILFTCSCMSNAIGLNISSAFNSAITIYILIPIILIPQLIFSGVVFSFEKLNPDLSSQDKVPIYGEIMTSRWAYEAAMVKQFTSNEFERIFYDVDKNITNAEYKSTYYIPELLFRLEEINNSNTNERTKEDNFELLRYELNKELELTGRDKFSDISKMNMTDFDSSAYVSAKRYLETLQRVYINRKNDFLKKKDSILSSYNQNEAMRKKLLHLRRNYKNDNINQIVKGLNDKTRIIEADNRLIRKVYPIYYDPEKPENKFNFRTHFYAPTKYFMGFYIDTFYFDLLVIWSMTVFLIFLLYFDILRFLVNRIESLITKPIPYYMRKNKNYLKLKMQQRRRRKLIIR